MKQSHLFTKTKKEVPKDEASKNAQLLIKAGFIYKEMAGVYAYLPLGLRVLEKIKQIVREEMDAIGGQEFIMTAIQRKELWEKTDRWSDDTVDVWFKSALKNGTEIGFGWSHEEPITDLMKQYLTSYRDLPTYVYQFQTKLRNELRAKSGIMRGREFIMKDMYSYSLNAEQHQKFYDEVIAAYLKVFARVGLEKETYVTFAAGGAFTQFSHEFQTITDAGEDVIYVNREKHIAINEEVLSDTVLKELGVTMDELEKVKTAEVGNIFNFGTVKCEQLGLSIVDTEGKSIPVHLGSYGIGITRLMGVLVEHFSDDKGIVWPEEVAPFQVHLVSLCKEPSDIEKADTLYAILQTSGIEVLYDDRDARPGEKFADSDLIGIPLRIVVSPRSLENNQVEFKYRKSGEEKLVSYMEVMKEM
ncbi:MAG: prolyl-tRNA synthetase [Candidatus Magasanikbacteria bacterium CG_4_9_14_0_2_um_filter_41_10]|uniref:Proline--tRNA ligase n=1 Tax=Candidatus Magasanikbacteria bacterium CG_4_10_14_0_2_um_filter_41_31 TaxID=1974639 RepID=A0A2M7V4L8_9BACT|nr:MAG: prolyl-tRNA synthetase [Candidatus Magasanikbacteria bacterium CG1_02_41_34]PIZ93419.1 MAG: prolyl-tRNA synthetase [Candidatus Magasanikbacteria bacterium CG_4_10_14_0_2_um_filter_41_31]PJC53233.1 MAG: prolyl-tRNA synthetase [Candidatus Magasanikbacteria bacterium CG_4_9_14_0_2_um_filter_41_10]